MSESTETVNLDALVEETALPSSPGFQPYQEARSEFWVLLPVFALALVFIHLIQPKKNKKEGGF